jgi:hypothetical protein
MTTLPCVNPQIIDAVTSSSMQVNGNASAHALALLYQTMAQSASLAAMNAVTMQQQSNLIHQATTTIGVNLIYALGGMSSVRSKKR